jgi:hypothetical protein
LHAFGNQTEKRPGVRPGDQRERHLLRRPVPQSVLIIGQL